MFVLQEHKGINITDKSKCWRKLFQLAAVMGFKSSGLETYLLAQDTEVQKAIQ